MVEPLFLAEARVVRVVSGHYLESPSRHPLLRKRRRADGSFPRSLLVHQLAVDVILVPRRKVVESVSIGIALPFLQRRPFPKLGFVFRQLAVGHCEPYGAEMRNRRDDIHEIGCLKIRGLALHIGLRMGTLLFLTLTKNMSMAENNSQASPLSLSITW